MERTRMELNNVPGRIGEKMRNEKDNEALKGEEDGGWRKHLEFFAPMVWYATYYMPLCGLFMENFFCLRLKDFFASFALFK